MIAEPLTEYCDRCGFPVDAAVSWENGVYCTTCAKIASPELLPPSASTREYAVKLRSCQDPIVAAIMDTLLTNRSTLAVAPTGIGKTVIIAAVLERWEPDGRMLVVAHREELIKQNRDKIQRFSGIDCDVEMGDQWADQCAVHQRCPVIVTSIQTMSRDSRHSRFHPEDFSLLVIDEAHHATSASYRAMIQYFRQNPNLKILGVTATPDRTDEQALGQIFETVAFNYQLVQAIEDGWLVPIQQQFVQVEGLDLSSVKTTAGDLNAGQLGEILEQEKILHEVAWPTIEMAQGEKTLVFAASVDQAEQLAAIFNRHQSGSARWICADQTRCTHDERVAALTGFTNGDFQFLVNCAILLEGYDEPSIKVVAVARPTKSRSLYAQMVGRGTRPLAGLVDGIADAAARRIAIAKSDKPSLLVLDYVGNSGRHKLIHTGDILGGDYDDDIIAAAVKEVQSKSSRNERADMLEELRAAEERKRQRILRAKQVTARVQFQSFSVDPFAVYDILPKREPGWFAGKKPTEKQLAFLDKAGVPLKDLSFCRASQLIEETIRRRDKKLCTYKQAKLLHKHGWNPDDISFTEASGIIDNIVKSRWTLRGPLG